MVLNNRTVEKIGQFLNDQLILLATTIDGIKYSSQSTVEEHPQYALPSGAEAKSSKVGAKPKDEIYGMGLSLIHI